jgi:hypothetical protein
MYMKKIAFGVIMATLITLMVPMTVTSSDDKIAVSLDDFFSCADLPMTVLVCYHRADRSCEGDSMTSNRCHITCYEDFVIHVVDCSAPALPVHWD